MDKISRAAAELIDRKLNAALQFHEDQKRQTLSDADARLDKLADQYSKRLGQEQDKISRIQRDVDIGRANRAKHLQEIEATYKGKVDHIRENQEQAMQEWRTEYDSACNMLKLDGMKFETALSATELDAEQELRSLQTTQRRKLQQSSEKSAEAYTSVEKHKAEVQVMQQTLRKVEAELVNLRKNRDETRKKLEESQQMCQKVEEQLNERSSVVSLRDEHVTKLKENESHLEGFRFLLYHKVKSLESERGPLAEYVDDLRSTVKDMYQEFVQVYREKTALGQEVTSTGAKVNSLQCEQKDLRSTRGDSERYGQFLFSDIADVMETFDETTVKRRLREILKKYDPSKQAAKQASGDKGAARLPLIT